MRFENVHGDGYTEIFLIGGHAITGHLVVYNTVGLNSRGLCTIGALVLFLSNRRLRKRLGDANARWAGRW